MFLGLKILFLLFISPFIIWLLVIGINNKEKIIGKLILLGFAVGFVFILVSMIISILGRKKVLDKRDFYGEYVIDRSYFKGKQADWQYDHFRFEITKDDSIFFYVTEKEKILETFKGTITTLKPYSSERLVIHMEQPSHHILTTNPTIYREPWDFYLVFNSPKFYNMFFRKGKWRNIEK